MRNRLQIQIHGRPVAGRSEDPGLFDIVLELMARCRQMIALIERMSAANTPASLDFYATYFRNILQRLAGIDPGAPGAHSRLYAIAGEIRQVQKTLLDACLARPSGVAHDSTASHGAYH